MIERMTLERWVAGVTLAVHEPVEAAEPKSFAPTYTVASASGRCLSFQNRTAAEAAFNEEVFGALGIALPNGRAN